MAAPARFATFSSSRVAGLLFPLGLWGAAAVFLYSLATPPVFPAIFPDEACNLSWARYLSGEAPHYVMGGAGFCHPTYPLLLAPLFHIAVGPEDLYRGVFFLNCLLVAACLPLAARLASTGFGLTQRQALIVGLTVIAYPTLTLFNHHAWPESALYPLALLSYLAFCRWVDRRDLRSLSAFGAASVALFAFHPKMLVFLVALLLGLALIILRKRGERDLRSHALWLLLGVLVVIYGFHYLKNVVAADVWLAGSMDVIGTVTSPSPVELLHSLVARVSGQLLYGALLTGGLLWLLFARGMRPLLAFSRRGSSKIPGFELKLAFIPVLILLMALETAVFLSGGTRLDTYFYGRHVDALLAAALVPALALFFRGEMSRNIVPIIFLLASTTFVVLALTIPGPPWPDYSRIHVLGAGVVTDHLFAAETRSSLIAMIGCLFAFTMLVSVGAVRGRSRWLGCAPLAVALVSAHLTSQPVVGTPLDQTIWNTLAAEEHCVVWWDGRIRERLAGHQFYRLQYYLPDCQFRFLANKSCSDVTGFVVAQARRTDCDQRQEPLRLPPDLFVYRAPSGQ